MFLLTGTKALCAVFSFEAEPDTGVALFPAGTMFRVVSQDKVSSNESKIGDRVSFMLVSDITVGKSVCIPEGSIFLGEVVELEQAQEGRNGYFRIAVVELVFADGWRTLINARVIDNSRTDIIGGRVTKRAEYKKIPHYIHRIGPVAKLARTGPRVIGQDRALSAGKELIIVLDRDLEVKYLQKM